MADAVEVSPPAKAKAAASAVSQSPPASARTTTVRVLGGGSLTVSTETPGIATDDKGRKVRITGHLAKSIFENLAVGTQMVANSVLGSGKSATDPVHTEEGSNDLSLTFDAT